MPHLSKRFSLGLVGALALACLAPASVRAASSPTDSERVLFAFDDRALPFQQGLKLSLVDSHLMAGKPSNVVMAPGPDGAPDSAGCYFYGSVVAVKDEFWMWYLGVAKDDAPAFEDHLRICLAKSKDGKHWVKPALDAVDYRGSRQNNLVALAGGEFVTGDPTLVCYEADEPDPARRFKMAYDSHKYKMGMAVAFSPDGVHWTESANNPCGPWFEPSGLVKWRGVYMVNGQSRGQWAAGGVGVRVLQTLVSYDFEHWAPTTALGFRRDAQFPRPVAVTGAEDGEQVHLGASVWNRGNVIIGLNGRWHGDSMKTPPNPTAKLTVDLLKGLKIDLGLLVSNDGIHYREPVRNFVAVAGGGEGKWDSEGVLQANAFANTATETYIWYSHWNTSNPSRLPSLPDPLPADLALKAPAVGLLTIARDRFSYFSKLRAVSEERRPEYNTELESSCLTRSLTLSVPSRLFLNLDDLKHDVNQKAAKDIAMQVALVDDAEKPLAGYTAEIKETGLKVSIPWEGGSATLPVKTPFRVKITWPIGMNEAKVYAIYVEHD